MAWRCRFPATAAQSHRIRSGLKPLNNSNLENKFSVGIDVALHSVAIPLLSAKKAGIKWDRLSTGRGLSLVTCQDVWTFFARTFFALEKLTRHFL